MESKPATAAGHAPRMNWVEPRHTAFNDSDAMPEASLVKLLDLLASLRADLSTGVLPRAARITGTSHRLAAAVDCVDSAIGIAREVLARARPKD